MARLCVLLLLALCFACAQAAHQHPTRRDALSHPYWIRGAPLAGSRTVELHVGLKQKNLKALKELVDAVSFPKSPKYGMHATLEEVTALVAPSEEEREVVKQYFRGIGAVSVSETLSKDFIVVVVPASKIAEHLGVTMFEWKHMASQRIVHRADHRVAFPKHVHDRVDVVTGLSDFFEYPAEKKGRKQYLAAKQVRAVNSSAPDIHVIRGGPQYITPNFVPYCLNGEPADLQLSCSDGSTIQAITVFVNQSLAKQHQTFEASELSCSVYQAPLVMCVTPPFLTAVPYQKVNVSIVVIGLSPTTGQWESAPGVYLTYAPLVPFINPETIRTLYNVPLNTRGLNPNNSQSIVAFEAQYISIQGDLHEFQRLMGLPQMDPIVHGANNESLPGGESTLDTQYIMGVGTNITTTFWSVSGDVRHGAYILEWALQVGNTTVAPLVTSISYGDTELGFYNNYGGWEYIDRMEVELQKMAARGLTVIAGSGDAGASNVGEAGNDLSPEDPTCTPFRPFYPSNSPYVTSLSATFVNTYSKPVCNDQPIGMGIVTCDQLGESAVGISQGTYWTTGGGFSNMSWNTRPSWQSAFVDQYFTWADTPGTGGSLPPNTYWNQGGRGYPDVSAVGFNLVLAWGGQLVPIGGTSASGPVFAGLVSLLNDHILDDGRQTGIGWLNPTLYQMATDKPEIFNDVTVGRNADGDTQFRNSAFPSICPFGFDCAPGWDPVSGLGTLNWGNAYSWLMKNFPLSRK